MVYRTARIADPRRYRVTLACGCSIIVRRQPLTRHVRYGCTANVGHGYNLPWTTWEPLGRPDAQGPA